MSSRDVTAFRSEVRRWCAEHVPADWRVRQTRASDEAYVEFQRWWFQELRHAGYAVPHWPKAWGGGMSTAEQVALYQELAAHDAPRPTLAFVAVHHAAATLLEAGSEEQQLRHLPAILDGEIWAQGFSEPEAGSDLANLRTRAARHGDVYVVNGQKLWASGAQHADWCLLLARTDPDAPKRHGISYLLMDMRSPGIDVRPVRQATGESEFCEIFLEDVEIPVANRVGPEHEGWAVAQATLNAERGMTVLELAERLWQAGFRWLLELCSIPGPGGSRPIDDMVVVDHLARFESQLVALRAMCATTVQRHDEGRSGPADASVVKLFYSELLQRMTDFGAEIAGVAGHARTDKPRSSGWESGAWVLDFIGSWEWTIPGGTSEIQRTIIAERGLGLPREPARQDR